MKVYLIRDTRASLIPLYWSEDARRYVSKGDADWYYEAEMPGIKLPDHGTWEEYFLNH